MTGTTLEEELAKVRRRLLQACERRFMAMCPYPGQQSHGRNVRTRQLSRESEDHVWHASSREDGPSELNKFSCAGWSHAESSLESKSFRRNRNLLRIKPQPCIVAVDCHHVLQKDYRCANWMRINNDWAVLKSPE